MTRKQQQRRARQTNAATTPAARQGDVAVIMDTLNHEIMGVIALRSGESAAEAKERFCANNDITWPETLAAITQLME